jgi:uncharacterized membrane protein YdfJ with MMPL/SSD domain
MGSDDPVAVLFGLSMDDEVFLLSRVREEYLHRGDNDAAVLLDAGLPEPEYEAVAVLGTDPEPAFESA